MNNEQHASLSARLLARISEVMAQEGGWLPFDRYMAMALYEPGLGYYSRPNRKIGLMPSSGSDFVTAPELSPLFGQALAKAVGAAMDACGVEEVVEFGAGTGALAEQLLGSLGARVRRYTIIDLSGDLRARQQARLAAWGDRVVWADQWPETMRAVVVGNEVLDAMPVQLLYHDGEQWLERGVALNPHYRGPQAAASADADPRLQSPLAYADRPTTLRPPLGTGPFVPETQLEIHAQAEAFMRTLAQHLNHGVAFFIDYGYPEREFYHPQRTGGTLMCHQLHRSDTNPLTAVGEKDITAHVNFTGVALAAQEAGLEVIGYTSQARFLMNCGLLALLSDQDVAAVANAQKLLTEHEMGEIFKVLAVGRGFSAEYLRSPSGFEAGDRLHQL